MFTSGFRINLTHIQRIIFRLHFPVSKNLRADPIFTSFATVSIPVKLYSLFANQLKVLELYCECWFSIGSSRWTNAHKWANVLLFRNYVLRSNCLIKPIALDIFRRFVFFFFLLPSILFEWKLGRRFYLMNRKLKLLHHLIRPTNVDQRDCTKQGEIVTQRNADRSSTHLLKLATPFFFLPLVFFFFSLSPFFFLL